MTTITMLRFARPLLLLALATLAGAPGSAVASHSVWRLDASRVGPESTAREQSDAPRRPLGPLTAVDDVEEEEEERRASLASKGAAPSAGPHTAALRASIGLASATRFTRGQRRDLRLPDLRGPPRC